MKLREALGQVVSAGLQDLRSLTRSFIGVTSGDVPPSMWLTGADTNWWQRFGLVRRPFAQVPTVHRAVTSIASSFGQLEAEVWPARRTEDSEAIEDHWLPHLLSAPSPMLRGDQMKEAIAIGLMIRGECFILHQDIRRDTGAGRERPHELWMLDPGSVYEELDGRGMVKTWNWLFGGRTIPLSQERMTFLKLPNPYHPIRGLSRLAAATIEYSADYDASLWNRRVYQNSAVPPIVFSPTEGEWDEGDREVFLKSWHDKLGGAWQHGLAGALPFGIKVDLLKLTQQEMDWLAGRRFSREQILSVFGVPPAIAGVFEYANYANSREQLKFYWHNTMLPLVRYVQASLTYDLLARYEPELALYFAVESILSDIAAADFKDKIATAAQIMSWGWTPASVNEAMRLGLPTKDQPWLQEGYLPFSLQRARDVAMPPEEEQETESGPAPADEEEPEEQEALIGPLALHLEAAAQALQRKEDPRAERWRAIASKYGDIARSYNRKLRTWLMGMRSTVLGKLKNGKAPQRSQVPEIFRALADDYLWEEKLAKAKLITISKPTWQRAMERGANVLAGETGLAIDFDMLDPRVLSFLATKTVKIVKIEERIRADVRATLLQGIDKGETTAQLAARVRERFDVERSRALTIARTETAQSFNGGRFEAMRQVGITKHEWITSRDTRVRDTHDAIDGEVVVVGEPFSNGVRYAGDVDGPPGEVINCRCANGAIVSEGGSSDASE